MHRIIRIADALLAAGCVPIVPHRSLVWDLISPKSYETWLDYDRQLLAHCDGLLRVPGVSHGATLEVEYAAALGIPVLRPISADPDDCVKAVAAWLAL